MSIVKFNGVEIPSFIKITGITFPVLPDVDVRETRVPRRLGNVDNGVKFGGKTINLSVVLLSDKNKSIQTQSDELKAWLKGDNWNVSKLVLGDQPNKYYLARVSNEVEINDLFVNGEGNIDFYSADPVKYDATESTANSTNAIANITYTGLENAPTNITIQVTSDCTNIQLTHQQTGKVLRLVGTFKIGQTINIDNSKKVVKLNGTTAMTLVAFDSDWLYLVSGANRITFTSSTSGVKNEFQIKYRKQD